MTTTALLPQTQQAAEIVGIALATALIILFVIFLIWCFNTERTEQKELAKYFEKLTQEERETINQYLIFKKKNAKLFKPKRKDK